MSEAGVGVRASNLSTWKIRAGGSGVQGHPRLYSKFEATVGCMRHCLKMFLFCFELGSHKQDTNHRRLFLKLVQAAKSKVKVLADSGPSEDALFGSQMVCPQMAEGPRCSLGLLL